MEILISTDNNYVMPAGVLMTSICENNKKENIRFHILIDESVTENSKKALNDITDKYNYNISYYLVVKSLFDGFPVGRDGLPISAYYRLAIAEILPEYIDKVLYLDSDIVVRHSLKDLWETDIDNYAIGCVLDSNCNDIQFYNRLKYSPSDGYFNSGVLLINLKKWRNENLFMKFKEYIKKHSDCIINSDQDVLNYVLRKNKFNLPLTYNFQHGFFLLKNPYLSWEYDKEIEATIRDPYILHFTGSEEKPWIKGCLHPYKNEFLKYKDMTIWARESLQNKKMTIKQMIHTLLHQLGIDVHRYSSSEKIFKNVLL